MTEFYRKYFVWENKWGIISGIIVVILGGISLFFPPSTPIQYLIYLAQAITILIFSATISAIMNHCRRETIESATNEALEKIGGKYIESTTKITLDRVEEKYKEIS